MWSEQAPTNELLNQIKLGDGSAVNLLMARHRNSIRQLVRMRLDARIQRRVDVSDVVQDVLVEVNRRLQKYIANPVMPIKLWIRQIAKDRIIDAHRRHRVSAKRSVDREQAMHPKASEQSSLNLAALIGDDNLTPAAAALQKELAWKIEATVGRLDHKYAEVIALRHYEHFSNQEVAKILKLSDAAASMRYLRAIRKLKELLNPQSGVR